MSERILILDDADGVRDSLGAILEDEGYRVDGAHSAAAARAALESAGFDLVHLDLVLPDGGGLELLEELQEDYVDLPVIVISGHGNVDAAVRATRFGAYDFLEKPLALERVVVTVHNALERVRMTRRLDQLASHLQRREELIGDSPPMRRLQDELKRAAASDSRNLIFGENGTGKELVARRAHALSPRSRAPFVEVNCAPSPRS